jgi:hypothetical protein
MKNIILNNWTFSRMLWVIIGMVIITEAILRKDLVTGVAGLVYTGMGIFNKTFCSLGACAFSPKIAEKQNEKTMINK